MIFHVTINSTSYEVEAETSSAAIVIALDTFGIDQGDEPDNCLNNDTDGICVCAEFAGDIVQEVIPEP